MSLVRRTPVDTAFLRWTFARAALARGWWLTTALYLVVVAELTPFELVLIGTFQGATVVVTEVPAGVLADTVSRRLSLVLAHVISGIGMAVAGMVTSFPALVVANCLWGMGWAFASGADVAWITDELDRPERIDRVLAAQGRWDLLGKPLGIAVLGGLAWVTSLAAAIVVAGCSFVVLGLVVVARWPEHGFARPSAGASLRASSVDVVRRGVRLARADRVIVVMVTATLILNGSHEGYGRLYERRLVNLGMPTSPDPVVWFTLLGLATVALGVVSLRAMEIRIDSADVARRAYRASCITGAGALACFAVAPSVGVAVIAALVVSATEVVPRVAATIRVNRRTTSEVRATVHSLLSWSENAGEILFGLALALLAAATSATVAILGSAVLLAVAGVVGSGAGNRRTP